MNVNNNEEQTENTNADMLTIECNSPTVNHDSSGSQKPKQQGMKAFSVRIIGITIAVVIVVVGLFSLLLNMAWNSISRLALGPDVYSYESYLNDKYGKSEKFSYTGKTEKSEGCPYLNDGWCTNMFTSEKTGNEFAVKYDRHNNSFSDKYYLAEYGYELEKYYRKKFSESFGEIIPYDFTISMEDHYPYLNLEQKLSSFEEVIAFLENSAEENQFNKYDVDINVDYNTIDWEKVDEINFEALRKQTNDLVQEKKLIINNVTLKITMAGSGRKGSCQEPFSTSINYHNHPQNANHQELEIESCYKILYSVYPQSYD